ncbi:MAG: hypothetical protein ACI9TY_001575 [Alphaproteobacteria bacterium]|jgi:hypothetical protein
MKPIHIIEKNGDDLPFTTSETVAVTQACTKKMDLLYKQVMKPFTDYQDALSQMVRDAERRGQIWKLRFERREHRKNYKRLLADISAKKSFSQHVKMNSLKFLRFFTSL